MKREYSSLAQFSFVLVIIGSALCLSVGAAYSQEFQFEPEVNSIPVVINGVQVYSPFSPGLENAKPAFADIDGDGDLDLFVGERGGTCYFYRNSGTLTAPSFTFETDSFASIDVGSFNAPAFVDIDDDEDLDLFIGEANGNINFYENSGSPTNAVFVLSEVTFVGIDVGSFSSPAFADLDKDGDFDLIIGEIDGNIHFYRNDGTGVAPNFVLVTENLSEIDVGRFASPSFVDLNNDGNLDLIVGNDRGNLLVYINTETSPELRFARARHADIFVRTHASNSAAAIADIDGDDDLDVFVGDQSGRVSYYPGRLAYFSYSLETRRFLTSDVTGMNFPTVADIDSDGDLDFFIGKHDGTIRFFRNIGNATTPMFAVEADTFSGIDVSFKNAPVFVDIDADTDLDLFIGHNGGTIYFFENVGSPAEFEFSLISSSFASIDVGFNSTPTFIDIDDDEDLDLFMGEGNGGINFFRNVGDKANPSFVFETDNFAKDVGENSAPVFRDIDEDRDLDLFVGQSSGGLYYYENIGGMSNPNFIRRSRSFTLLRVSSENKSVFADLEDDGRFDLFVGSTTGDIALYRNNGPATSPFFVQKSPRVLSSNVTLSNAPALVDIDNDDDLDLFVGHVGGVLEFYRNSGSAQNPAFVLETTFFDSIRAGFSIAPAFVDIDNDMDFDLCLGEDSGIISFYRNRGTTTSPLFELEEQVFAGIDVGDRSRPTFADIDNDDDFDLFIGETGGNIHHYENIGTPENAIFELKTTHFDSIDVGEISAPNFVDIDNDRDFDLLVGKKDGSISLFINQGDATAPTFIQETERLQSIDVGSHSVPILVDIDSDGDLDLFVGDVKGGLHFFRNSVIATNVESPVSGEHPRTFRLNQNYPNPFNATTAIRYALPVAGKVTLEIFDVLGREVFTLEDEAIKAAGFHETVADFSGLGSGVYFYRIRVEGEQRFQATKKLLFVK